MFLHIDSTSCRGGEFTQPRNSLSVVLCKMKLKTSLAAVHTINSDPVGGHPRGQRLLSVGKTYYSAETQLSDRNEKGEGEFCMRGRGVMMGYLNCEDKTMVSDFTPDQLDHGLRDLTLTQLLKRKAELTVA